MPGPDTLGLGEHEMRLELANFPISQISFGKEFRYEAGKLEVEEKELKGLVLEVPAKNGLTLDARDMIIGGVDN